MERARAALLWLASAMLVATILGTPARADDKTSDYKTVPLTRFELEDVYKFCSIAHRPGPAMVPCLIEQVEKIAREKQIQRLSKGAEAKTKEQLNR